jgi:dihydroorotate dehydrogenase electron transfer subunit
MACGIVAPEIAGQFQPGHFVAVAVGGPDTAMILRRALAISDATPGAEFAGTVSFVVAEHGAGTRWLVEQPAGFRLDVVGPLGRPFPLPSRPVPAVLVGGGYGTAPLVPLARALLASGTPLEVIVGAASADRLFGELVVRRTVGSVTVTTDDGSAGQQGRVTDALPEAIARTGAQVVYACGPMAMLRAVVAGGPRPRHRRAGGRRGVHGLRRRRVHDLRAAVRGDDGWSRFVRSCVDGPVFDGGRVRWDDVGRLPADLVGADAMGYTPSNRSAEKTPDSAGTQKRCPHDR